MHHADVFLPTRGGCKLNWPADLARNLQLHMEATASLPQAGTIYTRLSGVFEFQLKCSLFGMELSARLCLEGPRKAYILWHGADEDMQSSTQVSGLCILLMSSYVVAWYLYTFVGRRSVSSPHVHLEQARRMSRRPRHGVYRCDNLGITFAEASSPSHAFPAQRTRSSHINNTWASRRECCPLPTWIMRQTAPRLPGWLARISTEAMEPGPRATLVVCRFCTFVSTRSHDFLDERRS